MSTILRCLSSLNVSIKRFLINSGMCHCNNYNNYKCDWSSCRSNLMLQCQQHLFHTFCVISHSWRLEWTSIFCTSDVMCRALWHHLSPLPFQFSIFEDVGGWQPCIKILKRAFWLNSVEQKWKGYLSCQKTVHKESKGLDLIRAEPFWVALTPSPILGFFHWQHPNLQCSRSIAYWFN